MSSSKRFSLRIPDGWKAVEDQFRVFLVPDENDLSIDRGGAAYSGVQGRGPYIIVASTDIQNDTQRVMLPAEDQILKRFLYKDSNEAVRSEFSAAKTIQTAIQLPDKQVLITLKYENDDERISYIDVLETIEASIKID